MNNNTSSFKLVHRYLKKAKRRQGKYADKNSQPVEITVGDPVYYKNHARKSKLQGHWRPYFRVIKQTTPVTFIIKNQLDGTTTKAHAEHLRLAKIDDWDLTVIKNPGRVLRNTNYVVPPQHSDSDSDESDDTDSDTPLSKVAKRFCRERSSSSSEDDIPLMELAKRLRERDNEMSEGRASESREDSSDHDTGSIGEGQMVIGSSGDDPENQDHNELMDVSQVTRKPKGKKKSKSQRDVKPVKELLAALMKIL